MVDARDAYVNCFGVDLSMEQAVVLGTEQQRAAQVRHNRGLTPIGHEKK